MSPLIYISAFLMCKHFVSVSEIQVGPREDGVQETSADEKAEDASEEDRSSSSEEEESEEGRFRRVGRRQWSWREGKHSFICC